MTRTALTSAASRRSAKFQPTSFAPFDRFSIFNNESIREDECAEHYVTCGGVTAHTVIAGNNQSTYVRFKRGTIKPDADPAEAPVTGTGGRVRGAYEPSGPDGVARAAEGKEISLTAVLPGPTRPEAVVVARGDVLDGLDVSPVPEVDHAGVAVIAVTEADAWAGSVGGDARGGARQRPGGWRGLEAPDGAEVASARPHTSDGDVAPSVRVVCVEGRALRKGEPSSHGEHGESASGGLHSRFLRKTEGLGRKL
jgi:hypothetical protein